MRKERPHGIQPYVPPRFQRPTVSLEPQQKSKPIIASRQSKTVDIFEGMTLSELSKRAGQPISTLQNTLASVGEPVGSEFDPLSSDVLEIVAMEVGVKIRRLHSNEGTEVIPRPPVVTVMGHVDHGKTSLLDALRQTSVAAREAGGITQHLGAFVVAMPSGASITFLDTPGHAAFSAMRARGAAVTDIVVLVVAADDGVMPQTLEAIAHAKSANVPIVVAINKCDKPAADPERVKIQLASEGLLLEDMGGDVQVVYVSALAKTGLDVLEESLLLQAEMMDLRARVDGIAQAYVVEARLDRGRGPLVTAIVRAGTLVSGQHIVVGCEWGKIRAIRDAAGKAAAKATPAMPVEIEGLKGLPMAGDEITVVESEERAKMLSSARKQKFESERIMRRAEELEGVSDLAAAASEDAVKRVELAVIVKGDVQGTVQAVTDALKTLNNPQLFVNVVHVGVGPISQSDLELAQACSACIVGFNIKSPSNSLSLEASKAGVKIFQHRVIYHLLEDVGNLIVERAPGTPEIVVAGEAEVIALFEVNKSKSQGGYTKIAGCRVVKGQLASRSTMRLLRSGDVLVESPCGSLKREKSEVESVPTGNECGVVIRGWNDIRVGDVIHSLEVVVRKPKFVSSESGAVRIDC